jgi:hypothetical protein
LTNCRATGLEKNGGGVGIVPPGFAASISLVSFIASNKFKKVLGKINSDKKREERENGRSQAMGALILPLFLP